MSAPIEYGFLVEAKGITPPLFRQVHGAELVEVDDPRQVRRLLESPPDADGAVTAHPEVTLSVFTADCIPLLFFGTEPGAPIAAVHCGWRGALSGIAGAAYRRIAPRTSQTRVVFGPSILRCCFEVREDFIEAFRAKDRPIERYLEKRGDRWHCDLVRFVRCEELGTLSDEAVMTGELRCTSCSSPRLPSYRRDRGTDPRIRSWIRRART